MVTVPGTPVEPEALISVPLIARGALKGALNIYRIGEEAGFAEHEFELAKWFGDAAALAVDNAQIRARLEHLAQTDSLTGLYNHRFFHERLRAELTRASRTHDSVAVLMFDLDDFKRVNDVYGHGAGDQLLMQLARLARETVRDSDVVCRIGGEEFAVIMPSCDAGDALGLAARLTERPAGGRLRARRPHDRFDRDLAGPAARDEPARARRLRRVGDDGREGARQEPDRPLRRRCRRERPEPGAAAVARDVRSIAHLKMLQSLAGKLNRLNDVQQIGQTIATELRLLIDYHNCRVVLRDGDQLRPITFVGEYDSSVHSAADAYTSRVGVGITGRVAETGESLLVPNALECEFAYRIPGTQEIEESLALVPLRYGSRVTGVIVISKLGLNQFDEDDVRLLEVLAGQASVALENARLYEQQRREAEGAKALLAFADVVSRAHTVEEICEHTVADRGVAVRDRGRVAVARRRLRRERRPAAQRGHRRVALAEGDGIEGRLVLAAAALDEDRERLLASFSYQASVALQKARLYGKQLEAAEIANCAARGEPRARDRRVAGRGAGAERRGDGPRARHRARRTVDPGGRRRPATSSPRASNGYAADVDPAPARRFPGTLAHEWLDGRTEPFVLEPEAVAQHRGRRARADRAASSSLRCGSRAIASVRSPRRSATASSTTGSCGCSPGSPTRRSSRSRAQSTTRASSTPSCRPSRRSRTRSRRTTPTRRLTPAGSPTCRCSSGASCSLDRDALKRLELGALFHDIGKIGIPSEILQKPGPLTDEEFEIVKQHPELGEKILAPIDRLADVRPIVRACHERWDGLGYPDGKAGDEIPLEARIVLVCDAFHAMVTDRPYRERLPADEAVRRLREAAGTQFDPDCRGGVRPPLRRRRGAAARLEALVSRSPGRRRRARLAPSRAASSPAPESRSSPSARSASARPSV